MQEEHVFKSPVKPGDPLWWASETATDGPGPSLVQARRADNSVEAVLFDKDGLALVTDGGNREQVDTQYACLTEASCLKWIKSNMLDAVLLSGQTVKAMHVDIDGTKEIIDLECTVSAIEALFSSSSLMAGEMDGEGQFFICDTAGNQNNTTVTTFVRDRSGNPVSAIYGAFILMRAVKDEAESMLVPADLTGEVIQAVEETEAGSNGAAAYDPDFWSDACNVTVRSLKKYLERLPENTVVHCCGTSQCWLHYAPETNALSIDCESLSELPEYDGREPASLEGAGE